jgi:hypothetical protein
VAAERLWVVFPTNLDRDDGLVKVPSPGQLLSEMLIFRLADLPKSMAEGRSLVHEGHFEEEVWFHSLELSIKGIMPTINGLSVVKSQERDQQFQEQ